jgi:N-acetylglucosamine kinase-like BadF-type ATPase
MARFYLGIDGGQSSTTALIADEHGHIIGTGRGGPCNHVGSAEGRARFFRAIGASLEQACRQAGIDRDTRFASVCLGLSGGAEDKEAYAKELIRSDRYKLTHDAEIALTGATAGEPGIIIIAGTGSMAFGKNATGKTARAGGWGYIFGDEGGAFDLVRQALRAALRFEEGWGQPTTLHEALLEASGAPSANNLMHRFYNQFDRTQIASFAPLISRAAETGDEASKQIITRAAETLSWFVEGVFSNLFEGQQLVPVHYVGGVFESATLCQKLNKKLKSSINSTFGPPRLNPSEGALLESLRLDGNHSPLVGTPSVE